MPMPDEVIYLAIKQADHDTEFIKKFDWSGQSTMIFGKYGSSTLRHAGDKVEITIYKHSGPWQYMDAFVVYLIHASVIVISDN